MLWTGCCDCQLRSYPSGKDGWLTVFHDGTSGRPWSASGALFAATILLPGDKLTSFHHRYCLLLQLGAITVKEAIKRAGRTPVHQTRTCFPYHTLAVRGLWVSKPVVCDTALMRLFDTQLSGIQAQDVEEVILGNVVSGGIGQAPARQASMFAGACLSMTGRDELLFPLSVTFSPVDQGEISRSQGCLSLCQLSQGCPSRRWPSL